MAGISPKIHSIGPGEVPNGAYLEAATDGKRHYSICPPKGQKERYRFALYALPGEFSAGQEIPGPELLHNLTEASPEFRTPIQGVVAATYTRS